MRIEDASPALTLQAPISRAVALASVAKFLACRGIEDARRDARILLLAAAQISHADLLLEPDAPLNSDFAATLSAYAERRAAREPVSRIIGARGFWTLDLLVAPEVLDPRADTETLVELALRNFYDRRNEPLTILDLGTGSGAILCALLSELPGARGVAVDRSAAACAAASKNFERCGLGDRVEILRGDWAEAICATFDLVVSNPPYIRTVEIEKLAPEVRLHDPAIALDGGADGLACYRRLARQIPRLLAPAGLSVLEVGAGQAEAVRRVLEENALAIVATAKDSGGRERAIAAGKCGVKA